jgi:hypothetical protein
MSSKGTEISDWTQGRIVTMKCRLNGNEISGCVQARQFNYLWGEENKFLLQESYCRGKNPPTISRIHCR